MDCSEKRPLISLMCDDALSSKDTALLLEHLKGCNECRKEHEDLEQLRERFGPAREIAVPPNLMDDIFTNVRKESQQAKTRRTVSFIAPLSVAAGLLVAGLVFTWWNHSQQEQESQLALQQPDPQQSVQQQPGQQHPVQQQGQQPANETTKLAQNINLEALIDSASQPGKENKTVDLTPVTLQGKETKKILGGKLGWAIKFFPLPTWEMERAAVVKYSGGENTPIARFDFVRQEGPKTERLTCFQAKMGTISAQNAYNEKMIAGGKVLLGSRGSTQFALVHRNERDYLFISQEPLPTLEKIAIGS